MKNWKENITSEKGVMMVEASIYFPIVLGIVLLLIYFGCWKMQDTMAYFCAQKVANSAASALSQEHYEKLYGDIGENVLSIDKSVDFDWGDSTYVPQNAVIKYYEGSRKLYTRVKIDDKKYEKSLKKLIDVTQFVGFNSCKTDVGVEPGLLRTVVNVEVSIGFKMPGIIRVFGYSAAKAANSEMMLTSRGYQFVTEPVDFIRNADLAFDLVDYLFDRLGISAKIEEFKEKWDNIKTKFKIEDSE